MTKILNFALKIKGGGREGGAYEVLQPPQKTKTNLKRALEQKLTCSSNLKSAVTFLSVANDSETNNSVCQAMLASFTKALAKI